MQAVVGVFTTLTDAKCAADQLQAISLPREHVNFLLPDASKEEMQIVPTMETEQPGLGKVIGGIVGGAAGVVGGQVGATAVSIILPGVGPVLVIGLAAAALLGVGGVLAGAAAGSALEETVSQGLPKDELFVYEDALRQGCIVLIALIEEETQVDAARQVMEQCGAESLNAAREKWWLGLRSVEKEHYTRAQKRDFKTDEPRYRQGFEAALRPQTRGKSYEKAREYLQEHFPNIYDAEPFRFGYERGHQYHHNLKKET